MFVVQITTVKRFFEQYRKSDKFISSWKTIKMSRNFYKFYAFFEGDMNLVIITGAVLELKKGVNIKVDLRM